jgi:hypothetical protein
MCFTGLREFQYLRIEGDSELASATFKFGTTDLDKKDKLRAIYLRVFVFLDLRPLPDLRDL